MSKRSEDDSCTYEGKGRALGTLVFSGKLASNW